jgi:hypothetical protein
MPYKSLRGRGLCALARLSASNGSRMGMRREPSTTARKPTRHREVASCDGERRGCRPTFRGLLGVDRQRLYRISGIQAPSWCARRIQPQVYVWSDGFAWRIVRYASESRARDLSQFFPAGDAVAVHRNPSGNLKGFSGFSSRDGNCDRKLSVLDIRHEFVSCDLRSFAPLGGNLPNAEQVTSPNRNRIKPHPFGTSFARRRSAMAHESSSPRSSNEIAMSLTCKCFISIESKITPRPPGCDLVGIIIAALWYKIRLNDKLKGKLLP